LTSAPLKELRRVRVRAWAGKWSPLLVLLLVLIGTGLRGINFGLHWDERPWQIGPTKHMVSRGTPFPGYYNYPSFNYWVNLAVLAPHAVGAAKAESPKQHLLQVLDSPEYLLRLRMVYLGFTSLTLVWLYLLALRLGGSRWQAFFAAATLGGSWEVAYHLRWVATDGVLMQFAALTVLLAVSALQSRQERLLLAAAVTAGLGFATKYPGGLLVLPVSAAALLLSWRRPPWARLFALIKVGAVFALVFVAVTPASLFRTAEVMRAVMYEMQHYATGHGGHTVPRGWGHAWHLLMYYSTTFLSPYLVVALPAFGLAITGAWHLLRREPRSGAVVLLFPMLYLLYFSTQQAMVVRNLLCVAPFLALAAARGGWVVGEWLQERKARSSAQPIVKVAPIAWAAFAALALVANGVWLVTSAESIRARGSDRFIREAAHFIHSHPGTTFQLSPRVTRDLALLGSLPQNVRTTAEDADSVVLYAREGVKRWHDWPANRPTTPRVWFGPREVNFNAYPGWWGEDRVLVIHRSVADRIGLELGSLAEPRPAGDQRRVPDGPSEADLSSRLSDPGPLRSTWGLSAVDPRRLLSREEVEAIIGPLKFEPMRSGWEIDGHGCTYVAATGSVVTIVIVSTSAFEIQQREPGSRGLENIALPAFEDFVGPFRDRRLFARTRDHAVVVRVTPGPHATIESHGVAQQMAMMALSRLEAFDATADPGV
jgi:4-amino-4-deoxy-L-arabinose transferase-like glycosyltransferase